MIEVKDLTRHYGGFKAVDSVSFHIGRGEVVGLLGHNGAGKTTIMKMMTGFLEPTSGLIQIDGLEVGQHTQEVQTRIGYLPENCPLWTEMTVMDYLEFQCVMRNIAEAERSKAIRKAIARTALAEKALHPIVTLSRGYRQRVGVAQAILHNPAIIILDEPTNGLDPTQIKQMRSLIAELSQEATIIISTHIMQEVQAVCERVLILRAGKMAIDARLADLQKGDRLLVTLNQDSSRLLAGIAGVKTVLMREIRNGHYIHAVESQDGVAPEIAHAVSKAGLQLFALHPERHDLETVFAQVNDLGKAEEAPHV